MLTREVDEARSLATFKREALQEIRSMKCTCPLDRYIEWLLKVTLVEIMQTILIGS